MQLEVISKLVKFVIYKFISAMNIYIYTHIHTHIYIIYIYIINNVKYCFDNNVTKMLPRTSSFLLYY